MKNLDEMNLTELNSKEQTETDGGFIVGLIAGGIGSLMLGYALGEAYLAWEVADYARR